MALEDNQIDRKEDPFCEAFHEAKVSVSTEDFQKALSINLKLAKLRTGKSTSFYRKQREKRLLVQLERLKKKIAA